MNSTGKTVLVTGGAGFIGSHVAALMAKKGHQVVVLDDLSGGFEENVPKEAEFVLGSILDTKLLDDLFARYKFTYVYHLAAYAAEGLSPFIRKFNYENNLIGSINLINRSVLFGVERFVFTSSIAVYGPNQSPMNEGMKPDPVDPYGVSKYAVEMDLKCAADLFGLKYTIFRPHNVYGEGQNIGDRYRNVIGIFMNQAMLDQSFTIFGDGQQTRAFSYISDVSIPMVECLDKPETIGEVFNIGADIPFTVLELSKEVNLAMGKETPVRFLPERHEPKHVYADHTKVRTFFPNLSAAVSLKEGLSKMAKWAIQHGPRKTKPFTGIEISHRMPESWTEYIQ